MVIIKNGISNVPYSESAFLFVNVVFLFKDMLMLKANLPFLVLILHSLATTGFT